MAIFNSYVKLPEGTHGDSSGKLHANTGGWFFCTHFNCDGNAENGIGFTIDSEKLWFDDLQKTSDDIWWLTPWKMEDYPVEMGMCQFSTQRVMFTWQQTNNPGELFRQEFLFWSQNKYSKGSHYRKLDMSQIWRPREQQMGWSFSVGTV